MADAHEPQTSVNPVSIENDAEAQRARRINDLQAQADGIRRQRTRHMNEWDRLGREAEPILAELRGLGVSVRV